MAELDERASTIRRARRTVLAAAMAGAALLASGSFDAASATGTGRHGPSTSYQHRSGGHHGWQKRCGPSPTTTTSTTTSTTSTSTTTTTDPPE